MSVKVIDKSKINKIDVSGVKWLYSSHICVKVICSSISLIYAVLSGMKNIEQDMVSQLWFMFIILEGKSKN